MKTVRYFKVQLNIDTPSQHCDIEICLPTCFLCVNMIHNLFLGETKETEHAKNVKAKLITFAPLFFLNGNLWRIGVEGVGGSPHIASRRCPHQAANFMQPSTCL